MFEIEKFPNKSGFYDRRIAEIIHIATQRNIERGTYEYGYEFDVGLYCTDNEISEIALISSRARIELANENHLSV